MVIRVSALVSKQQSSGKLSRLRLAKKLSLAAFVIAVAFRAHALRQAVECYDLSELSAGVLAAPITMKEGASALR